MEYSGAQGTLFYEQNLKAKISCQTPFKMCMLVARVVSLSIDQTKPNWGEGVTML